MTFTFLIAVALATTGAAPGPAPPRVVKVRYTPQDRVAGRYQYVPFDVPPGTTRIAFRYGYDRAGGANVIDLGVLEPGPLDLGSPAFRGWSGGARDSAFITEATATPGYWPGPLPAGQWHVVLGLYKVADAGVDVEVTVETSSGTDDGALALPARPREPGVHVQPTAASTATAP